jgi:hypothetical protein
MGIVYLMAKQKPKSVAYQVVAKQCGKKTATLLEEMPL